MRRLLSVIVVLGLVLSLSLATAVPVQGADLYVPSVTYPTIASALAAANDGDDIYVAAGTYNEYNLIMEQGVDLFGAGASSTIIDAQNNNHVINASSINSSTTLDGFTITGGNYNYGGGIYNSNSSLVISNCIITGNTAVNHGGGIYNINSSAPLVVNCVIDNNTAGSRGGGMYIDSSSSPTITNCTIADNTASQGGGIFSGGTSPTITNNIIADNTATTGEGIYCNTSTLIIDYNDVYPTSATYLVNCTSNNDPAADPDFTDGLYHIDSDSPCIDMGTNGAPSIPATDYEGEPRVFDGDLVPGAVADIGADEYFVNSNPNAPLNLGPTEYTGGGTVTDDTPTLTFEQSDPDVTDTIQYTIEIDDDAGFSPPTEAYTSALLAQGPTSFTSSGLPDGSYYWRVMSTDQWGATSGWSYANGGAVAFQLDTSPTGGGTVGGTVHPIDKAALLLPWLISGAALVLAAGGFILARRRS